VFGEALAALPQQHPPTAVEDALANWCQALLVSNGFLYVD
jgi:hypothetical protein